MTEKKPLSDEMNHTALEDGKQIFKELLKKWPDPTIRHADLIFNSLLMALLCHRHTFCFHDPEGFKKLVNTVLDANP